MNLPVNVECTEDLDDAEVAYGKIICESECTVLELAPDGSLIPRRIVLSPGRISGKMKLE